MDNKEFTPTVQPFVRTRRSAAARAAANAQELQSSAAAEGYVPAEPVPAVRKRSSELLLTAPVVYEPSRRELRTPSVKPVEFRDAGNGGGAHSMRTFVILSILAGIAGGVFLAMLHFDNHLFRSTDISSYDGGTLILHCVAWGGIVGLIYSLLLSPIHKRLSSTLPVYAMLLFLPVIVFMLTPLLAIANELAKWVVSAILYIGAIMLGLFFAFSFFCG